MTQLERLKIRITDEVTDEELSDILESAKAVILSRRYPFGDMPEELEPRYLDLQIRIAVEMYNKIGTEGQTAHSENGVSRSYASAAVSPELLREITPKAVIR
uniref:Tail connector protein n=1 Tax=Siphoviridae sp. ctBmU27 TaxID=2826189 RepID=A0A8S5N9G5_9CAUD|nr:MAG TPA: tail connector protein [Siphoviridae sp. ctBmU27]